MDPQHVPHDAESIAYEQKGAGVGPGAQHEQQQVCAAQTEAG